MKLEDQEMCTTANIVIKDESGENMGRFFCTHAVLCELFQTIASAPGYNIDKNMTTYLQI